MLKWRSSCLESMNRGYADLSNLQLILITVAAQDAEL